MKSTAWRLHACVFVAFVGVAMAQTWPLPMKMGSRLTGQPTGDTGVYVWNLWVFSHQIFVTGTTPLNTRVILPLTDEPTDLSLNNYTMFSGVLAVPLLGRLGVVRTFNVIYLFNAALVGFGLYLLARRLTGRVAESFLAGLTFACSPFIVARGGGHFSLAAAAPLPVFMLMLYRTWDSQRLRDAVLAGAVLAWAGLSDPYYAVYCVMLGACFVGSRVLDVSLARRPASDRRAAKYLIHAAMAAIVAVVAGVLVLGGGEVHLGALRLTMRTLFTPMLLLTALVLARLAISTSLRVATIPAPPWRFVLRAALAGGLTAGVLLSPTLYAMARRVVQGDVTSVPVLWRSSAPGVDLLAFFVPNPNHPWAPASLVDWLTSGPGGYIEQVASLSLVGFAILIAASRRAGFRPPRLWLAVTMGFALLTLGPFLHIAGVNTEIPAPWALLRYVPLVGSARMPARFAAVATMGFSVLLVFALAALTTRFPARRLAILSIAGLALAAELIAVPRPLYSAEAPSVFAIIAADPRPVRVLELPTGVRDGLSSIGDFNADAQFYQTFHGKGLIGGYLSRVPPSAKARYRELPVTSALLDLSEGRALDAQQRYRAMAGAAEFVRATNLGYVVMNRARVSDDLRGFATTLLGLTKIADADGYELYVPKRPG